MSQIPAVAKRFYQQMWAIVPSVFDEMEFVVESREQGIRWDANDIKAEIERRTEAAASEGRRTESTPYTVRAGIAMLPLYGPITQKMDLLNEISGGTSTEAFQAALAQALDDSSVQSIVIDTDSPGGSVYGVAEASNAIYAARKRKKIYAIARSEMASAAYWIASAASEVIASPSAAVGSIGVFMKVRNSAVAEQNAGMRTEVIKAGRFKAAGNPHEPMHSEDRQVLQDQVDAIYSDFVRAVARNRGMGEATANKVADGRIHTAEAAQSLGLVDRVENVESLLQRIIGSHLAMNMTKGRAENERLIVSVSNEEKPTMAELNGTAGPAVDEKAIRAEIRTKELARINGFREQVKALAPSLHGADVDALAEKLIASDAEGPDDPKAKALILDEMIKNPDNKPVGRLEAGTPEIAKFREVAADGLALRCMSEDVIGSFTGGSRSQQRIIGATRKNLPGGHVRVDYSPHRKVSPDAHSFRAMPLIELGVMCLERSGFRGARQMLYSDRNGLADILMGRPDVQAGHLGGGEYHRTGDFPGLLADAQNKLLQAAYMEAPSSYRQWVHIAESFRDFKAKNVLRLGSAGDLEAIPEGGVFPEDKLGETKSTYVPETYGKAHSFTRVMLINDDLSAFSDLTVRRAQAAERTVNRAVYALLTGGTSSTIIDFDSTVLFHSNHANIVGSPAVPSVAELNKMQAILRKQTDPTRSTTKLNAELAFIIAPAALEGGVLELLSSTANPASSGNSGINNIWQNRITPVIDAELTSETEYYGAARWQQASHIEVAFLAGEETPRMEDEYDFDTKGRKFTIHQTWGVKAVDYVGIVQDPDT